MGGEDGQMAPVGAWAGPGPVGPEPREGERGETCGCPLPFSRLSRTGVPGPDARAVTSRNVTNVVRGRR